MTGHEIFMEGAADINAFEAPSAAICWDLSLSVAREGGDNKAPSAALHINQLIGAKPGPRSERC